MVAKAFELDTVAEFVELEATRNYLLTCDVTYAAGESMVGKIS